MVRRIIFLCSCFFVAFSVAWPAAAQQDMRPDSARLERYYKEYLQATTPRNKEYYEGLIKSERERVRASLEEAVNALVQPSDAVAGQELEASKAIDRQRELVDDLSGRLNESTVDLNLLKDEEKVYDLGQTGSGTFMTTKSYPELLAKKVILEENIDLLQSALTAQQKRLQRLLSEQRSASMGTFLTVLGYLALIFLVVTAEHFLRTRILLQIPHRKIRYFFAKLFTVLVYLSLFFWLAQRLIAEYPGFLTVFAVIGAALVFMLQDVFKSFFGWLTYKGSLALGQRVTVGGHTGDVLDINMLFTTVLISRSPGLEDATQAGKTVRVPNFHLLSGSLVNYNSTSDYENAEIPVRIADPKQWERAYEVLDEILQEEAKGYAQAAERQMDKRMRGFYFSQVSPSARIYMELDADRSLQFLLCFPAPIGQRRAVTTRLLQRVLECLEKESIRLANPK
ncbi:MAG: mechanosensitive ion channel [Candidatus Peribacteraceae bacterium]|nr:mechanosensitive ion channel [Candidatus Peribacteraceae bacterium]